MSSTPATPTATGRREDRDGTSYVVFERTFTAPIADVWAAVTEPERLERGSEPGREIRPAGRSSSG